MTIIKVKFGDKYNRLLVLNPYAERRNGYWVHLCLCDCGNERLVSHGNLVGEKTKSCGCLRNERVAEAKAKYPKEQIGTHKVWVGMMGRCYIKSNAAYSKYGAVGIRVCDRWHDFSKFFEDMGPRPQGKSIDRIDGKLGYAPENCRWASSRVQAINQVKERRNSSGRVGVHFIKSRGVYRAGIRIDGRWIHLGAFAKYEDAVTARKAAEENRYKELEMAGEI